MSKLLPNGGCLQEGIQKVLLFCRVQIITELRLLARRNAKGPPILSCPNYYRTVAACKKESKRSSYSVVSKLLPNCDCLQEGIQKVLLFCRVQITTELRLLARRNPKGPPILSCPNYYRTATACKKESKRSSYSVLPCRVPHTTAGSYVTLHHEMSRNVPSLLLQ